MTACLLGLLTLGVAGTARAAGYLIGPDDVLSVRIFSEAELTGAYTVQQDGSIPFPLIGRINAAGLTIRQLEDKLRLSLSDGFLKNPQVSVSVAEYRSRRVFIVGEVREPGLYTVAGDIALIELLARAGSTTEFAGDQVLVVRGRAGSAVAVTEPTATDSEVVRVSMRELQQGRSGINVRIHDGDTVFVSRAPGSVGRTASQN